MYVVPSRRVDQLKDCGSVRTATRRSPPRGTPCAPCEPVLGGASAGPGRHPIAAAAARAAMRIRRLCRRCLVKNWPGSQQAGRSQLYQARACRRSLRADSQAHAFLQPRWLAQVRHGNGDTARKSKKSAHEVTKSALHSAFHSRWVGMVMSS